MATQIPSSINRSAFNKQCASLITDKVLQLIIFPTEQCNFRCVYCYEDFSIGRMQPETVSSVKKLIENRASNLKHLDISWFGGEPLLAKDIILDICSHAASLMKVYPSLSYSSHMTTNAYLLGINLAEKLSSVGVRKYQISLDGPKEIHDKSRIRADGKSTFEIIWNNLIDIRNSSLPINIDLRLHFTADTFKYIDQLIVEIKKEFLPDSRFGFYFKSIEHLGGANDSSINIFSEKEKIEAIKVLESKLFGTNSNSSQNASFSDSYVCYASKPNSLVIRANGTIGKCTVALADERNNIGSLQADGTLRLQPERLSSWMRGIETLDQRTLSCPLVNLPAENNNTGESQKERQLQAVIQ